MGVEKLKKCRLIFASALVVTIILMIYYGYYRCSGINRFECSLFHTSPSPWQKQSESLKTSASAIDLSYRSRKLDKAFDSGIENDNYTDIKFEEDDVYREYDLDLEEEDVLVFVHIQKTGGTTFGRHLVKNLDVQPPCKCYRGRKKCDCYTKDHKVWLFSRFSTGWVCGLHADWTELTSCIEPTMEKKLEKVHRNRIYHFITLLRQPVYRYISEWKHVQRGATWKTARLVCNGRKATLKEVPFCYAGEDWRSVSLDEFMACPHNLANNRQTRMLANLSLVNCYNHSGIPEKQYKDTLLESAKENLKNMAFIGLLEYQNYTQRLFEHTFNLKFKDDFEQYDKTHSGKATKHITAEQLRKIQDLNSLDAKLYHFAKELFFQRLSAMEAENNSSSKISFELLNQANEDDVEYYYDYEEGEEADSEEDGEEPVVKETDEGEEPAVKETDELKSFLRDMEGS